MMSGLVVMELLKFSSACSLVVKLDRCHAVHALDHRR